MINRKPVIGIIPTYNLENPNDDPYVDKASFVRMYADKIEASGGIPIGIINTNVSLYTSICDGYIWPGGGKINHEFYPLIDDAIKNNKPFLGICLGAQAIATLFNILEDKKAHPDKTLREVYDINKKNNPYIRKIEDSNLHLNYVTRDINSINNAKHQIIIEPNSFLANIYGEEKIDVVSLHSYAINRTTNNLIVSAKEGNVIEAIEYHENGSLILGVQFHPEILEDSRIFKWLINNCNKE